MWKLPNRVWQIIWECWGPTREVDIWKLASDFEWVIHMATWRRAVKYVLGRRWNMSKYSAQSIIFWAIIPWMLWQNNYRQSSYIQRHNAIRADWFHLGAPRWHRRSSELRALIEQAEPQWCLVNYERWKKSYRAHAVIFHDPWLTTRTRQRWLVIDIQGMCMIGGVNEVNLVCLISWQRRNWTLNHSTARWNETFVELSKTLYHIQAFGTYTCRWP